MKPGEAFAGGGTLLRLAALLLRARVRSFLRSLARPLGLLLGLLRFVLGAILLAGVALTPTTAPGLIPVSLLPAELDPRELVRSLLALAVLAWGLIGIAAAALVGLGRLSPPELALFIPAPVGPGCLLAWSLGRAALVLGAFGLVAALVARDPAASLACSLAGAFLLASALTLAPLALDLILSRLPARRRTAAGSLVVTLASSLPLGLALLGLLRERALTFEAARPLLALVSPVQAVLGARSLASGLPVLLAWGLVDLCLLAVVLHPASSVREMFLARGDREAEARARFREGRLLQRVARKRSPEDGPRAGDGPGAASGVHGHSSRHGEESARPRALGWVVALVSPSLLRLVRERSTWPALALALGAAALVGALSLPRLTPLGAAEAALAGCAAAALLLGPSALRVDLRGLGPAREWLFNWPVGELPLVLGNSSGPALGLALLAAVPALAGAVLAPVGRRPLWLAAVVVLPLLAVMVSLAGQFAHLVLRRAGGEARGSLDGGRLARGLLLELSVALAALASGLALVGGAALLAPSPGGRVALAALLLLLALSALVAATVGLGRRSLA